MSESKQLWTVGGGNYVAHMRFSRIADVIAQKFSAVRDQTPGAREPTPEELTTLRERYLEHQALNEHFEKLRDVPKSANVELLATLLKFAYRLVVFAAAITILYRAWHF